MFRGGPWVIHWLDVKMSLFNYVCKDEKVLYYQPSNQPACFVSSKCMRFSFVDGLCRNARSVSSSQLRLDEVESAAIRRSHTVARESGSEKPQRKLWRT